MFVGEYEYKVDNKGRLPLPPRFRKEIEDGLVLTMVADNCILAYTRADWNSMTAKHASDSFLLSERQRKINRFIFSNANEVNIDNQGRIALPSTLRERCGISDAAVVAGNNNYFEIWNPTGWQEGRPTLEEVRQLADDREEKK